MNVRGERVIHIDLNEEEANMLLTILIRAKEDYDGEKEYDFICEMYDEMFK